MSEYQNNMKAVLRLQKAAAALAMLPTKMAEYYANGGDGVGQGVVGDRFQGKGNERFVPLSYDYFKRKQSVMNKLNKHAKLTYGRGSKILKNVPYRSTTGIMTGHGSGRNLPILVLFGKLRAAVTARKHPIAQQGDTAIITFQGLPVYALFHHLGAPKINLPIRSPVEPDSNDMARVQEFAERWVSAEIGDGSVLSSFGQGIPRII